MEKDWERRTNNFKINIKIAEQLFFPLFPNCKINNLELLSGGLANSNYKISIDDKIFILRIFTRNKDSCLKEFNIYNLIKEKVKIPKIYYFSIESNIIHYPYSICEFIKGNQLKNNLKSKYINDLAYNTGIELANIHSFKFKNFGFFNNKLKVNKENIPIKDWFLNYIYESLNNKNLLSKISKELLYKIQNYIQNNDYLLEYCENEYSLIHADFKPTNIFVYKSNISSILDWEFSFSFNYLFDIGMLFRYEKQMNKDFEKFFVQGYTTNKNLSENWKEISNFLDFANLLSFLTLEGDRPNLNKNIINLISIRVN